MGLYERGELRFEALGFIHRLVVDSVDEIVDGFIILPRFYDLVPAGGIRWNASGEHSVDLD